MGINNLNVFLRKNCPEVFKEIHISEYAYKKVAIDTSLFLCKFKAIAGDRWLESFIRLVSCLRRNEIHCVFIYDTSAPPEKNDERAERRKQQEKLKRQVLDLETSLENYYNTGEFDQSLLDLYEKEKNKPEKKRLITKVKKMASDDIQIDIIVKRIEKMRSNILQISKEDFELTKQLFDILNIPYYCAPMEAETCCSDLCKRGIVDAVMSEDTDVLAYNAPVFLTKIDTFNDTCVRIHHKDILEALEIDYSQFLDLCIMCGCDYNTNIPKVGPQTAFKYIKEFGTIENISKSKNIDVSILKHDRCRDLFLNYEKIKLETIPFCGSPNLLSLQTFIIENKLNINIKKLEKDFTHKDIIVIEDDDDDNSNLEVNKSNYKDDEKNSTSDEEHNKDVEFKKDTVKDNENEYEDIIIDDEEIELTIKL
jgi:flap endonuclease-1